MTAEQDQVPAATAPLDLTIDELLTTTRTVRRRLDLQRPVSRATVEECLRLAFQAPNGSNQQGWGWVLVDDRATKEAMAALYRAGLEDHRRGDTTGEIAATPSPRRTSSVLHLLEHMPQVPVLVVPTVDTRYGSTTTFQQASMWGSVLPGVWSFMLALRSRGLGSAWTTLHLYREAEMAELLAIPYPENTQAGLFPIAYTIGTEFRPGDRAQSEQRIFWNRWAGS
jgi:nitroreductase